MNKKAFIIGSTTVLASMSAVAFLAFAQTSPPQGLSLNGMPPFMVQVLHTGKVMVRGAKVTDTSGSTITAVTSLNSFNVTWTVSTDNSTEFVRMEGGRGTSSEIAKDHIISFEGMLVAASGTQPTVLAKVVRDWSIMKVPVNQFGIVGSINAAAKSFVLKTDVRERGDLNVFTSDTTKFWKQGATTTFAVLKVGDKVTVQGLWDKTLNSVQAEQVRIHVEDRRTFTGGKLQSVASSTPPTSITVRFGRFDYTVYIALDTAVLKANWERVPLTSFRVGDQINVYGVADGIHIEATVVRDVSLR